MPFANARSIEPDEWDGWGVVEGGYSILVEEYTATWCPRCAEIDPDLSIVAEEHGKRIAMVSYHPDDGMRLLQKLRNTVYSDSKSAESIQVLQAIHHLWSTTVDS